MADNTSNRGFASMAQEKQRSIARKGGETVSRDRSHMAEIGRKGGETVSRNREHMAEIGRKGGEARGENTGSGARSRDTQSQRNNQGSSRR